MFIKCTELFLNTLRAVHVQFLNNEKTFFELFFKYSQGKLAFPNHDIHVYECDEMLHICRISSGSSLSKYPFWGLQYTQRVN